MKLKIVLLLSILINLWFTTSIIRLEKFHYSTMIGMCSETRIEGNKLLREYDDLQMYNCLSKNQPRTSDLWNLAYGLRIL